MNNSSKIVENWQSYFMENLVIKTIINLIKYLFLITEGTRFAIGRQIGQFPAAREQRIARKVSE